MHDPQCPNCGLILSQHDASHHLDWWVTSCLGLHPDRTQHYSSNSLAAVSLLGPLFKLDVKSEVMIRKGEVLIPCAGPGGATRVIVGDFPLSVTKAFLYMWTDKNG